MDMNEGKVKREEKLGRALDDAQLVKYDEEKTTMQELFGAHTIAALDANPEARRRLRQAKDIIARHNMGARQQDALMLCTILRAILDNPSAFAAFAGEMYERRPGARA